MNKTNIFGQYGNTLSQAVQMHKIHA